VPARIRANRLARSCPLAWRREPCRWSRATVGPARHTSQLLSICAGLKPRRRCSTTVARAVCPAPACAPHAESKTVAAPDARHARSCSLRPPASCPAGHDRRPPPAVAIELARNRGSGPAEISCNGPRPRALSQIHLDHRPLPDVQVLVAVRHNATISSLWKCCTWSLNLPYSAS